MDRNNSCSCKACVCVTLKDTESGSVAQQAAFAGFSSLCGSKVECVHFLRNDWCETEGSFSCLFSGVKAVTSSLLSWNSTRLNAETLGYFVTHTVGSGSCHTSLYISPML